MYDFVLATVTEAGSSAVEWAGLELRHRFIMSRAPPRGHASNMAALSQQEGDEDSELEFEDEDDPTLIEKCRRILRENQGILAAGIESPAAVMKPLRRHQVLNKEDCEEILAKVTTREQNEAMITILMRRSAVRMFTVLVDALWRVRPELANELQPVRCTIVWFAPDPVHAAAIASTLEKHARVRLGAVQSEADYLCRPSRGRVFDLSDVRLWLVFPAKLADKTRPALVPDMVRAALSRIWPRATLAVMSGVCDGVGGRVVPGQPIFVTEAVKPRRSSEGALGDVVGPRPVDIETARQTFQQLEQAQTRPPWLAEVESSHLEPSSLQYQSHWLARLYSEIRRAKEEEKSQWLESIGWDVANPALSERHHSILDSKLSDWKPGKLASVLLGNRALWQVDAASPLGMSPSESLRDRIDSNVRSDQNYPARLEARPPAINPQFGVIATPDQEDETADQSSSAGSRVWPPPETLGCDSDSFPFLERCRAGLNATCPRLVCKVVRYDMKEAETVCVTTSTCWLLEAVKSFVQNREE